MSDADNVRTSCFDRDHTIKLLNNTFMDHTSTTNLTLLFHAPDFLQLRVKMWKWVVARFEVVACRQINVRPAQLRVWICVPLPHLNLQGHEMPRPLIVITLILHPFHISHLFSNVKWNLPHLNFDFSILLLPSKISRNCCEMWNRNEAWPTPFSHKFRTQIDPNCAVLALAYRCFWTQPPTVSRWCSFFCSLKLQSPAKLKLFPLNYTLG